MANATAAEKRGDKVEEKIDKNVVGKVSEKLAEKRRALGRGLESLLPGPRAVAAPAPTLPQSARKDGAPDASSPSDSSSPTAISPHIATQTSSAAGTDLPSHSGGRAGTPVAPPASDVVDSLQASGAGRTLDGEVLLLELDQIEQNPYQTRTEFEERALSDLAGS